MAESSAYEMAAAQAFHLRHNHRFLSGVPISNPDDRLYPLMMSVAFGENQ